LESLKNVLDSVEIDFVSWRYHAGALSILMVAASLVGFTVVGPNWGIDFTGGTEIHLRFDEEVDIGDIRDALKELGLGSDSVQTAGGSDANEFKVRIQDPEFGMEDLAQEVRGKLDAAFGADWIQDWDVSAEVGARFTITHAGETEVAPQDVEAALKGVDGVRAQSGRDQNIVVVTVPGLSRLVQQRISEVLGEHKFLVLSIEAVGPKVGGELRRQGFISIAATLCLVLLYVGFRFDMAFAPGAIIALIHDVSITVGIFTFLQLEFNLPMIGALLTIVGYSLNDTIVIYDRIRENRDRYRRKDTGDLINVSINETLTRTVATSVTTMLALSMFLLLGGDVIRNFALAMFLGIIFGTYSTVFVASPMILLMEDARPWLSRFIALPDIGEDDDEAADPEAAEVDESEMTESEKRRRERADGERRLLED
jgi:preprotein translocase subunit SecF